MLRLLQSIFGVGEITGGYPEWLIRKAIERAVDGTDPWLRAVSGYKKKLRPAVIRAIDYVVALVNGLPPSVAVGFERRGEEPLLKAFFISEDEMRKVFGNDRNLAAFLKGVEAVPDKVTALLVMEKNEKLIFRPEMTGDTVEREMPRMAVSFDAHRLFDPSGDEDQTRRMLMRRAYDHLLSLALGRISRIKTERSELERRHALLDSKLNILRRGGWGFEGAGSAAEPDIAAFEEEIGRIETRLGDAGGDEHILQAYLDIVIDVLSRPEEYLWGKIETIILDSMGIRRDQPACNACELTLHELFNCEGRSIVVLPVVLDGGEIRGICG